jgi:peroxiredoxin
VPAQQAFSKQCNPNGDVLLLSDFRHKAIRQYGLALEEGPRPNQRATFILDKGGILRYKYVEPDPGQWQGLEPEFAQLKQLQ